MKLRKHPLAKLGDCYAERTVIGFASTCDRKGRGQRVKWRCSCGREGESYVYNLRRLTGCIHAPESRYVRSPVGPHRYKPAERPSDLGGLSQSECAARLGISRARVSQIERRAMRKMAKLASELGMVFAELFDERELMPAKPTRHVHRD